MGCVDVRHRELFPRSVSEFLEFLWVFLGFFLGFGFVLDSSSQPSYASLLFKPEQGQSKQRGEGLPFPPASCLLHVFRLTWSL